MNKSTTILLLASLASIALGVGATLGVSYGFGINYGTSQTDQVEDTDSGDGLETEVTEVNKMQIKLLSAETTQEGKRAQIYSYTIIPANATNQNINTSVEYQDGGEATEVTASVDTAEKTITLVSETTGFNKVILVKLTAADGGGASATITCNFKKKILGWTFSEEGANGYHAMRYGQEESQKEKLNGGTCTWQELFFGNTSIVPTYSLYTIDTDFLTMDSTYWMNTDVTVNFYNSALDSYPVAKTALENALKQTLIGQASLPSASDIYGYADGQQYETDYKSKLKSLSTIEFNLSGTVGTQSTYPYGVAPIEFGNEDLEESGTLRLDYDFSNLTLNISEIDVSGADNVIF